MSIEVWKERTRGLSSRVLYRGKCATCERVSGTFEADDVDVAVTKLRQRGWTVGNTTTCAICVMKKHPLKPLPSIDMRDEYR